MDDLECVTEPSGEIEHAVGEAHEVHVADAHGRVDCLGGVDDVGNVVRVLGDKLLDRGCQGVCWRLREDVVRYLGLRGRCG